jgi:hypothetical protein
MTPGGNTSDFFSFLDQQNNAIAAREAEEAEKTKSRLEVGVDPVRFERDAARRERLGELRAREHTSKRPHRARPVFGHVNPG